MTTIEIYLWVNAVLYAGFAFWCGLKPTATASFSGISFINTSGRSEYFALYVGLEAAWAAMYAWCALHEDFRSAGLFFSVVLYAGLVSGRWISILQKGAASKNTYYIAAIEIALGIWAIVLYRSM